MQFFPKTLFYCTITEKMCDIFIKKITLQKEPDDAVESPKTKGFPFR